MLAKFPHADPPGAPSPVLLGLEFFLAHQASFTVRPPAQASTVELP
jgi:hypothetical protein